MKKKAKRYWIFAFFALFFFVFGCPASAMETGEGADVETEAKAVAEELEQFRGSIPPEVADLLPSDFFSADVTEMGDAVREMSAPRTIFSVIGSVTGLAVVEYLSVLARICGLLLVSAVFRMLTKGRESGAALEGAVSFCGTAALAVGIFSMQRTVFKELSVYFDGLQTLSAAFLPLMGGLYAMGGNVGAAVVNHGVMSAFLSILETVVSGSVLPVAGICLVLALADALSGGGRLRSLAGLIKRSYALFFSFLMLILCGVLGIQTTLAKGSDTLALRTVRFAAGSFLPVVGGSVSEALRTVSGSVQYLRTVVGMGGVVVVLLFFLPFFLNVMLGRITFLLSGAAAKLLGCDGEEKLLSEMASVYGYFMAVIASLFVMTVFSLTLFARCATAGGGV